MTKRKVLVKGKKTLYTFAYLRTISWACHKRAKESIKGRNLLISSSMVFTAFSIEAYLNHLGSNVTDFWDSVERKLSPREKLDLISSILKIKIDYGSRPFQTFVNMFAFRNALAHGSTEILSAESIQILSDEDIPSLPKASWEESITLESATRYLEDGKAIVLHLNSKAKLDSDLLWTPETAEWQIVPLDQA